MAQRLQQHIAVTCVRIFASTDCRDAVQLFAALRRLLDSPALLPEKATSTHALLHASSGTEASMSEKQPKKQSLIGSLVVPVVMELIALLKDDDVRHKRSILDLLLVLYYKVRLCL
jgi:hypothetical protein